MIAARFHQTCTGGGIFWPGNSGSFFRATSRNVSAGDLMLALRTVEEFLESQDLDLAFAGCLGSIV